VPSRCRLTAGALLAAAIFPIAASAQAPQSVEPAADAKTGKVLRAYRITGASPRIDGQLDDEAWTVAAKLEDLVQNEPEAMAPPTERTTVQVAFDDRAVYVAAYCYMSDPSQIVSALGRRDALPPSDVVRIAFDPRHDHNTGYVFHVNPAGVQLDDMFFDDTRFSPDYDAVWEVQTAIVADGWIAELRIPFSQLRFSARPGETMTWGFQVRRDIFRKAEFSRWVPTPRGEQGNVSRYGHLVLEGGIAPPRRLEVLPYSSVRSERAPDVDTDNDLAGGLDMRIGLGPSNTISATFNPDFGQVEQDPAVLNLSVFETFFPEKRPFFLEDSRIFVLPFPQFPVFHSRRIGQRPNRYSLASDETLVYRPDQTTILGASKLTGKTGSWTYGALSALTSAEYATVDITTEDAAGNETVRRGERLIEPRTSYNVARVQRDLRNGTSNLGGVWTGVLRDGDKDAHTAGFDYNMRFKRNLWRWDGHWIGTKAPVSGTVREGFGGANRINYSGKHVNFNYHLDHFSRYFRNADLGFFGSRPNKTSTNGFVSIGDPDPKKYYRRLYGFFGGGTTFNPEVVLDRFVNTGMDFNPLNFWYIGWNAGRNFQAMDDLDTRGGPPIVRPASNWLNVFVASDQRKTWRFNVNGGITRDAAGGSYDRVGLFLSLQPSSQLQASVSTNYSFGTTAAQWIENIDTTGDGVDENVYGTLRQNVLDFTGRLTYSFTRNLTFQLFLQPFVAVGDYSNIRALARPRSYEFTPVTIDRDPDFNSKSLRTNSVLRWEYRPGSTLFVVWNRSASDSSRPGLFRAWNDIGSAFGAEGTHVFMVKLNYWLGL
jgi:hypothetical protein